jgi:hypothetical protein
MAHTGVRAVDRIREWQPQTTESGFIRTQIGFQTTQISRTFNTRDVNRSMALNTTSQTGFMTTREALSILPSKQLSNSYSSKKRRAEPSALPSSNTKPPTAVQTSLSTWITGRTEVKEKAPLTRALSSGIVQDRGPPFRKIQQSPLIPTCLPSSSPERGYDPDLLPAVSFSSPYDDSPRPRSKLTATNDLAEDDALTSPLLPTAMPVPSAGPVPSARRSLGIRRDMKPWTSKK